MKGCQGQLYFNDKICDWEVVRYAQFAVYIAIIFICDVLISKDYDKSNVNIYVKLEKFSYVSMFL